MRIAGQVEASFPRRSCPATLMRLAIALFVAATLHMATASAAAPHLRVSQMGQDGDTERAALYPALAYDTNANQYLAVWSGDDEADDELEIYARLLDAQGNPVQDQARLTHTGPDGDPAYAALTPKVTFNPASGEYLVVWIATADQEGFAQDEYEIYALRLDAGGSPLGDPLRVSEAGGKGNADYGALDPAVTANTKTGEYLVAWSQDSDADGLVDDEFEVFARRLSADAAPAGQRLRISQMGTDASPLYDANHPALAHDPTADEYLVAWQGDDDKAGQANDAMEVFAQRLDAEGNQVGQDDFAVSDMGADPADTSYDAQSPTLTYNPSSGEYLIVWAADDDTSPLADGEEEIFGQRLSASGEELGANDFRISGMGQDGDAHYDAQTPALAYDGAGTYLAVWQADDDQEPLEDEELEIFGQKLAQDGQGLLADEVRISRMGADGDPAYGAYEPQIAQGAAPGSQLVAWQGDDDALADDEYEVFATAQFGLSADLFQSAESSALALRGADRTPPSLALRTRRRWSPARQGALAARIRSDEDCEARVRFKLRLTHPRRRAVFSAVAKAELDADRKKTVRLRLAGHLGNLAARHAGSDRKLGATVIASCSDAAQNEARARKSLTVTNLGKKG